MRGDIPAAALRLSATLPVRTHERALEDKKQGGPRVMPKQPRVVKGCGRGGNQGRAVIVGTKRFDTIKDAKEFLHVGNYTVGQMLADGRMRRA